MSLDKRVRFSKMDAVWGVNGPAEVCTVGAEISVAKRDGGVGRVRILSATPARPGYVDCTIESLDRRPDSAPPKAAPAVASGRAGYRSGDVAPGRRTCPMCGARGCARAWDPRALCDED